MIYLNNASTSYPKPIEVVNSINEYLSLPPVNFGRSGVIMGEKNIVNDLRQKVSKFFHADDSYYVVFNSGSTESLNLAVNGLDLTGTEVIITSTEHNSLIRPLKNLENKGKISIITVPCDATGFVIPENIEKSVNSRTSLICVNHCSNVTGTVQDVAKISEIARKKGVKLLVDGSQASGNLIIDFRKFMPDIYVFTAHKSLYGLQGSGGVLFKKELNLSPFKLGGTGAMSHLLTQPDEFPYKYESGTMNIPALVALSTGLDWINKVGLENIIAHKKNLTQTFINELEHLQNIKFYYNSESSSGTIVSFTIDNIPNDDVNYILQNSFDIAIRSGLHCAPIIHQHLKTYPSGTLRISPSFFSTEDEIYTTSKAIISIIEGYNG